MKTIKNLLGKFRNHESINVATCRHEHSNPQNEHLDSGTKYQCPMKCEGGKTYENPGRCPVCGMYLQPGNSNASSNHYCCKN